MKNYFETYQHPEQKDRSSQVLLHFFRHAEPERDPSKPNAAFELTKEGQRQAVEKGKAVGPKNIKQSVAFGSPRKRAQHTSGLVMASELLEIENTPSSLESLKEGLNSGLKVGEKIGAEPVRQRFRGLLRKDLVVRHSAQGRRPGYQQAI
jgi:broad specificity phosphatase PhoE